MKRKDNVHYGEVLLILKDLGKKFPDYNMGRHLATAFDGYGDIWGMTDKEMAFALNKYRIQIELDEPHLTGEDELAEIIKGGMNLTLLDDLD